MTIPTEHKYDVALSFAGENRPYVARVADSLVKAEVRLFYDEYEKVTLWGKDLYAHLSVVYKSQARYTVVFASAQYAEKLWTSHELKSAQARAITERGEYILPARFDDSEIPGVLPTTGYIDLRNTTPEELADLILAKLDRKRGSWESADIARLPGDPLERGESLRSMAQRLTRDATSRDRRQRILDSSEGVGRANHEAEKLKGYIEAEIAFLREINPALKLGFTYTVQRVISVRSDRASFTMHFGIQHANTLDGAALYVQEFDGAYMAGGRLREAERVSSWAFELDDAEAPRWRRTSGKDLPLTTKQLADRYLSWVFRRVYGAT